LGEREATYCKIKHITKLYTEVSHTKGRTSRRIFEPKREELAGGWRRLRNEELHNLYSSQNIIKAIKSRKI
jgi:hypothetical protein